MAKKKAKPTKKPAKKKKVSYTKPPKPPKPQAKIMGRVYGVLGIVSAAVCLLFFPLLFGILAVFLGVKAWRLGSHKLGPTAIVLGLFMTILGAAQLISVLTSTGVL